MQGTQTDRDDLALLADEVHPILADRPVDTKSHDLAELWRDLGGSD
jgi:hypothetical protein